MAYKNKIFAGIFVLVGVCLLLSTVSALEDNFQEYAIDSHLIEVSDYWVASSSTGVHVTTYTTYQQMATSITAGLTADYTLGNKYPEGSSYWAFTARRDGDNNQFGTRFLNESGTILATMNIANDIIDVGELVEYVYLPGNIYLFVDGVLQAGETESCAELPYYIRIIQNDGHYPQFDDFSNDDGYVIGIGEYQNNHFATEFDEPTIVVSYTTNQYYDSGSDFALKVKRMTTGEIKDLTDLSTPAGYVTYDRTTLLGNDYGWYQFYVTRDGQEMDDDYLFYMDSGETSTLNFVNDMYAIGETVYADYYIADYSSACNYYLKVFNPYGTEVYSGSVTGETGTETFTAGTDWEVGTYYGVLYKECSDGVDIAIDVFTLSNTMQVQGITYDAEAETALPNVDVSFVQGATYFNTTSNATGHYNLSSIPIDIDVDVNASIANYTHNDFSFTPLQAGLYTIDLYLLPNVTYITFTNTSVGGLVTRCPFHQAIYNANVTLWNTSSSWNQSTTTNTLGYYLFDDIPNGTTYNINASNQQCDTQTDAISTLDGSYLYHYFCLECWYNLSVSAKDASTHVTLTNFDVILDETVSRTAAMIYANFTDVDYGIHKIEVSKPGYYTAIDYVYVYDDTFATVYLTPTDMVPPGGAGFYYPLPHKVEFTVMSWWGHKYPGVLVNVTGYEISHPQSWLDILFGINNETEIYNTSMNGTTDSGGSISFMMVETIKYRMTFTNASESINEVWYKYPKDDHYIVITTPASSPYLPPGNWYDCINFTANWTAINDTHAYINFYYNDTCLETHSVTMYINNTDTNETYVWNFTNTSDCNITNNQTIVDHTGGGSFFVGFYVVGHGTYGSFFSKYVIKFKYFLDVGLPQSACRMLSIALLFFMACFFGATSVNAGAIIVNVPAWIFYFWGWLLIVDDATTILVLSLTTTIAVIAYMTYRSRRVLND